MTIKECIDIVDSSKPNQYTIKDKVIWLSFVEGVIINEVLKTHEGYDGRYDLFDGYTEDNLTITLIVPSPYDRLYTAYLKMKIDQENGETARYNNSMMMYNSYMLEWRKHYNKTHMPIDVTSKAKHMIPPRTSSAGLSEAEFESLKRELTYIMTQYFGDSVSEDKIYQAVYNYVQNNLELLKGKNGYTPVKGVDYFTDADIKAVADIIKAEVGVNSTELQAMLNTKADKTYVKEVEFIAKGRASGYVFDTQEDMEVWLKNAENINKLKLGDNLYIRATKVPDYWWDGSAPQQLETQKVDLAEYVKKEDGKGLSKIINIEIEESDDLEFPSTMTIRRVDDAMGIPQVIEFYNTILMREHILGLYENMEQKTEVVYDEDSTAILTTVVNKQKKFYMQPIDSIYFYESPDFTIGSHMYMSFQTSDINAVVSTDGYINIRWIGDDCNAEGRFTPQPNTEYEVSLKRTIGGIIARVGVVR